MTAATRVAVVGGGPAGAAAAFALRDADAAVTVFEAVALGGRATTRRHDGCVYDLGANYLKSGDERVAALVTGELSAGLVDVDEPVWTFDGDGEIGPGDDRDDHKWSYEDGLAELSHRLLARSGADVRVGVRVDRVDRLDDGWHLRGEERPLGLFDRVILTPPAPETADLLAAGDWDDPLRETLVAAARDVSYRAIDSAALHYPFELDRPWYALVNTDRSHAVGWLAREACKPGHVPVGESLLVVQLAPDWSAAHATADHATVTTAAAERTAELLDDDRLAAPDWADLRRWRHALPNGGADADALDAAAERGLLFAGDWVAGDGRVHLALRSGLDAGERLAAGP